MRVLNVGGGSAPLPPDYDGAQVFLLDADPAVNPAFCFDAVELEERKREVGLFDAIYCSHALEHFYRHDVPKVLRGFRAVLKEGGFIEVLVPNLTHCITTMLGRGLDIEDTYYRAGVDPISFHDVLYGWDKAMRGGNLFYAHKCSFTPASLYLAVRSAGFNDIAVSDNGPNLKVVAKCP